MSKNSTNMFYLGVFLCVVCAVAAVSKLWNIVEDRGAWHAVVHVVAELDMIERLHFHFHLK